MKKLACLLTTSFLLGLPAAALAQEKAQQPQQLQKPQKPQSGCRSCELAGTETSPRARLTIRWKRLVLGKDKKTAPQHVATEQAIDQAFATLQKALAPLGVEVKLQKAEISEASFKKDPTRSNRLWINGASLEMYLPKAKVGKVMDKKTGVALRTLEFAGRSFRDIPADMIVQAGLIAAGDSVKQALTETQILAGGGCCEDRLQKPEPKPKASDCCKEQAQQKSDCCKEQAQKKTDCCKEQAQKKTDCCKEQAQKKTDCCKEQAQKKTDCCKEQAQKKTDCCKEQVQKQKKSGCCEESAKKK